MRFPGATEDCWLDGRRVVVGQAQLSMGDPAFQAGLGLFETLALVDGLVLDLDLHLDRMHDGAERLRIALPPREALRAIVLEAGSDGAPPCGWLKVIVTASGRTLAVRGVLDPGEVGRPASAILLPWRRNPEDPLAGLKTLNYAANLVGLEWARARGADEGLWLNTRGLLAEGCTSNLFVVRGGRLFTPAVREGILPGVVRALTISAARRLGLAVHEGRLRLTRLKRAQEAFLTSSLRGVRPLVSLESRPVGCGEPGRVTTAIAAEVARARLAGGLAPDPTPKA